MGGVSNRKGIEKGDRGQTPGTEQINRTELDIHMRAYTLDWICSLFITTSFMTIPCFQTSLTKPAQILSYSYSQVCPGHNRTNIYSGNQSLRGFDSVQVSNLISTQVNKMNHKRLFVLGFPLVSISISRGKGFRLKKKNHTKKMLPLLDPQM